MQNRDRGEAGHVRYSRRRTTSSRMPANWWAHH